MEGLAFLLEGESCCLLSAGWLTFFINSCFPPLFTFNSRFNATSTSRSDITLSFPLFGPNAGKSPNKRYFLLGSAFSLFLLSSANCFASYDNKNHLGKQ